MSSLSMKSIGPQSYALPGDSLPVTAVHHSFRVAHRTTPGSEPATLQRIVEYRSAVLTSLVPVTQVVITGLATTDEPAAGDAGWALLIPNDLLWIEVAFTAGEPASYAIKSYGAGDEWAVDFTGLQSLVEWTGAGTEADPFVQTVARAVIARAPADAEGLPRLVQVAHSDFLLVDYDLDGKAMKVLEPFCGGVA